MTFRDFQYLNELWAQDQIFYTKLAYESMRLQTFFIFSLQVDKKHKKSFERFCVEYMPFIWDKKDKPRSEEQEILEKLSEKDWQEIEQSNYIRNITSTHKKASVSML